MYSDSQLSHRLALKLVEIQAGSEWDTQFWESELFWWKS